MNTGEGQPVRILRIIARMNVGGPAWQVSVLTRELDRDRFQSRLIAGDVSEGEADFIELRDPDLPVVKVPVLGRSVGFGDDLRAFVAIRRAMRDYRPVIVHTHTAKAGLLGRIAAATCRIPVRVHTFHGHVLHGYFNRWVARVIRVVEGLLARRTTALVAIGERVRDELIEAGIGQPDQYVVIPPGVALEALPDRLSARGVLGLPLNQPVILFVGRLTANKAPFLFLEGVAKAVNEKKDIQVLIVGQGPLVSKLRKRTMTLGLSDNVEFKRWVSNSAELANYYRSSRCLVCTSYSEGGPRVVAEALACGTPIITTRVGLGSELIEDGVNGFFIDSIDTIFD